MTNRPKKDGTQHETDLVNWLVKMGWVYSKRITQKGSSDEGDVILSERVPWIFEAKHSRGTTDRATVGTWVREMETEVRNAKAEGGAVVAKRKGTLDVGEYIAIMPVKFLEALLREVYPLGLGAPGTPEDPPKRMRRIHRYQ